MTEKIEKRVGWDYKGTLYGSEDEAKLAAIREFVMTRFGPHGEESLKEQVEIWQKALELYGPVHFGGEG